MAMKLSMNNGMCMKNIILSKKQRICIFYCLVLFILFAVYFSSILITSISHPIKGNLFVCAISVLFYFFNFFFVSLYDFFLCLGAWLWLGGIILSVFLSLKKGSFYPFCLLYIFLFVLYFFLAYICILFFATETDTSKKDYSSLQGVEFTWTKGEISDFAFEDSDIIHVVSFSDHELDNDEKLALVNASLIIKALKVFHLENGMYPESLKELIPTYLSKIPKTGYTGFWESHEFDYKKDPLYYYNEAFDLYFNGGFEDFHWHESRNMWYFEYD